MKKAMILLICCVLALSCAVAQAVSYTLPEKMERQLTIGSGLKGSFTLKMEGEGEAMTLLSPLSGAEFQVRGILSDGDLHYYAYQTDPQENQWAKTEVYRKADEWYLKSDLLPGRILMLPALRKTIDTLTAGEGGNPSFASGLWNLLTIPAQTWDEDWKNAITPYESMIESWLSGFASDPIVRTESDGSLAMDLNYVIPMEAMKAEAVNLLTSMAVDESLRALLEKQLTPEQVDIYLNANLDYFYADALNALNLGFDAALSRTMTIQGDLVASSIELPLDLATTGYESLLLESAGDGYTSYTLENSERSYQVIVPDGIQEKNSWSLWVIRRPGEEAEEPCEALAIRLDGNKALNTWEDEDTRSHQTELYTITAQRDVSRLLDGENEADFVAFDTARAVADLHFSSKYAQSSPTTLAFTLSWEQGNTGISLTGQVKSASPWIFTPFTVTEPISLLSLRAEERSALGLEWLTNAVQQVRVVEETETEGVAETPEETPAPTSESTEMPETTPDRTDAPEEPSEPVDESTEVPAETGTESDG